MFDIIVIFGMFVPVILLRHAKDHTRSNVYLGAFFLTMSIYPLYRSVLVNFASESFLAVFLPVLMPVLCYQARCCTCMYEIIYPSIRFD